MSVDIPGIVNMQSNEGDEAKGPEYDMYCYYHILMAKESFCPFEGENYCSCSFLACCIPRILCHSCHYAVWSILIYNKWAPPDIKERAPHSEPLWPVDTYRWKKPFAEAVRGQVEGAPGEGAADNTTSDAADRGIISE